MQKKSILKKLFKEYVNYVTKKERLMEYNPIPSLAVMCTGCLTMIYFVIQLACTPNNVAYAKENIPIVEELSVPVINLEDSVQMIEPLPSPVIEAGLARVANDSIIQEQIISGPDMNMVEYNTTVYIAYNGNVNIRSIPSTDGDILGSYSYRDSVEVVKRGDGWLKTSDGNYIYENATTTEEPPLLKLVGNFKITAYCTCSKCCGRNAAHGLTKSGTRPVAGRTISVDPKIIPLGSKVQINGHDYIAEDTGSAIKGNIIDMYFDTHQQALQFGVHYADIYIYK